jgi:hypothetical protein
VERAREIVLHAKDLEALIQSFHRRETSSLMACTRLSKAHAKCSGKNLALVAQTQISFVLALLQGTLFLLPQIMACTIVEGLKKSFPFG